MPNWEAAGAISTRRGAMPPGFEDHTVCSDPFRKFSILLDSSTASEICVMTRSDWIGRVLSIELSRFYHGAICTLLALDRVAESSRPEITTTDF